MDSSAMHSCTIADPARSQIRLRLQEAQLPVNRRYGGGTGDDGLTSSPAGLHRRPWCKRLRHALHEDLFVVHYQPIVSLADGRHAHYEALVRLADEPDGRLVMPGRFLPAAERYGLVREIDRLVIAHVTELLGRRLGRGARVAVNLSALSVTDATMLGHIARCIDRHNVDPGLLVIEITETAAISDMERARAFCKGVSALGCAVALDDFGAGFGSFQYLTRLPLDYLKIDGSFVRRLPSSLNDQLVVRALAGLARGMGMQTIAEYVTDRATMQLLRRCGVDYAQGFGLGRPQPQISLSRS